MKLSKTQKGILYILIGLVGIIVIWYRPAKGTFPKWPGMLLCIGAVIEGGVFIWRGQKLKSQSKQ